MLLFGMVLFGLTTHTAAQSSEFEWPEKIDCHIPLLSGDVAQLTVSLDEEIEVTQFVSDTWEIDPTTIELKLLESNERKTRFELSLSDDMTEIHVGLWAQKSDRFGIKLGYAGSSEDGFAWPIGNGLCTASRDQKLVAPIETESLTALIYSRPFEAEPVCHAVNEDGERISYSIPPLADTKALFKPISGLEGVGEIEMLLIDGFPIIDEVEKIKVTTNYNLYAEGGKTRGFFQIYGVPAKTDWMFLSTMTSINADRENEVVFAGHCGGELS
ncbi:MAG: hypothetical protein AAGL10_02810 [Pseudomonadota bacterium]